MSVINSKFRIHGWGENRGGREGEMSIKISSILYFCLLARIVLSGAFKTGKFVSNSF